MTRRERIAAKIERRQTWAVGRQAKAETLSHAADPYRGDTAFNTQPGHIPERARVIAKLDQAFQHSAMAAHHAAKADGLQRQLDRSVFSDDPDAIESLRARIAQREAQRDRMKRVNQLYKQGDAAGLAALGLDLARLQAQIATADSWEKQPHPAWELTNLGANIRRDKERITEIERRAADSAAAEAAGGVRLTIHPASYPGGPTYGAVTFAEKPERAILTALREAGWRWTGHQWVGTMATLPAEVSELVQSTTPPAITEEG